MMKYFKIKNIAICITLLGMLTFYACSDNDSFDVNGDPYNRVYIVDRANSYKIIQTGMSSIVDMKYELPLKCSKKASGNIRGTIEVDNSLIEAYNKEHGTNYEAMPASALIIENSVMNIPTGAMVATDTLRITMTKDQSILSGLSSEKGYLVPLRLTSVEGGDSHISSNLVSAYLIVNISDNVVNHDATQSNITGTLVTDQTGWSATTNATVSGSYQPLSYLFTPATSSYCYMYNTSADGLILSINMNKPYTFDAITLHRSTSTASLTSGMVIYTSNDGITWKSIGELTKSSTFCVFYEPITTQYIRIIKPKAASGNTTLYASRFNIYAK